MTSERSIERLRQISATSAHAETLVDRAAREAAYLEAAQLAEDALSEVDGSMRALVEGEIVALWYRAGDWDRAKRWAYEFLHAGTQEAWRIEEVLGRIMAGAPAPDPAMAELTATLAGGAVRHGLAPSGVVSRVKKHLTQMVRAVHQRMLDLEPDTVDPRSTVLRRGADVLEGVPSAGSYEISLWIESHLTDAWLDAESNLVAERPAADDGPEPTHIAFPSAASVVRATASTLEVISDDPEQAVDAYGKAWASEYLSIARGLVSPRGEERVCVCGAGSGTRAEFTPETRVALDAVTKQLQSEPTPTTSVGTVVGVRLLEDRDLSVRIRSRGRDLVWRASAAEVARFGSLMAKRVEIAGTEVFENGRLVRRIDAIEALDARAT